MVFLLHTDTQEQQQPEAAQLHGFCNSDREMFIFPDIKVMLSFQMTECTPFTHN
jgi:hypothetical protein